MNKRILHLAIPSIISNITVPLLGLVDMAIVGHLGSAAYIGAIAVGGMLFNIMYWLFGFLRMGTSGMTAQALGRRDRAELLRVLARALAVAAGSALLLLFLREPIIRLAFRWIDTTEEVRRLAEVYFRICVWGAPAVLGLYGLTGWFIGMQNARIPMWIAITQNAINIGTSACLVFGLGRHLEGVAWGTLIAQYAGFLFALGGWIHQYGRRWWRYLDLWGVWERTAMRRFFSLNRDIFLRTLCLVAVTSFFTSTGARQGEVILAVNTLLMQLFTLFSYVMDGFAYAGEALAGRLIGAKNVEGLRACVRRLFQWGIGLAVAFTLLYGVGGKGFLGLLTNDATVVEAAGEYLGWAMAIPLCGFAAFLWDGLFIGATASRQMLYAMGVASAVFFVLYYSFRLAWGNHALWLAFLVYLLLRGAMQGFLWWRMRKADAAG